ncbi:MAG: choice-of-anchor B family protein [Flavobacteriales bacterium]|nr:choice-of-anchor B family protein [Flavobacteriales bacterium]
MKHLCTILFCVAANSLFAQGSLNIDSLFNWQDSTIIPSTAHNNRYNEIWGYAKNGKEYAIIGSSKGTHIFDVTVPAESEQVVFIEGKVTGSTVVHRDFHDFDDCLYMVSDEGNASLQIADLRFLPDSAPLVYDSGELFPRSHNIFIDSSSARMYVCGGPLLFAVFSLADPTSPTLLLNCPLDVPFWGPIGYVHDTYVRGDTAYLNAGTNGLFVVDFHDINNPVMIGSMDVYPQSGYNHSGWLMADKPYYALADETFGKDVKIVDVSDMADLHVVDTITSGVDENSIPHNLIYRGDQLFISYYFDGLYMFDCSDPTHPQLAGFYDTSTEPHVNGLYRGCWGVYPLLPSGHILASDMQTGLWVFGSNLVAGVNEPSKDATKDLTVYPNPVENVLHLGKNYTNIRYRISDMAGREVMHGKSIGTIDVSELGTGIYVITVLADDATLQSRFFKR